LRASRLKMLRREGFQPLINAAYVTSDPRYRFTCCSPGVTGIAAPPVAAWAPDAGQFPAS
ncbi:hypothetical protein LB507_002163, partial [Fusarium sp. FIESC RH6]